MAMNNEEESVGKPSEMEMFDMSGPVHLTSVDWRILEHRRSVAACLVNGVYTFETDRQQKRMDHKALAPLWWEFFHFQCIQILVDEVDSSVFGAIFEYKPYTQNSFYPTLAQNLSPPRYVIAFRGTMINRDTRKRDLYLDIQIALYGLTRDTRYQTGFQAVEDLVTRVGPANVWLTGHSLGAAMALQVGKDMVKMGCYLETYLFNPPYVSLPIEKIKGRLNDGIRIAKSVATTGLSRVLKGKNTRDISSRQYDPFTMLCSWTPYLFVNPKDTICNEYIGHFEHREKMEAAKIERNATPKSSKASLLSGSLLGRDHEKASHLVPSAFVTKNMVVMEQGLGLAHGLHQWWKPHTCWQSNLYQLH